MRWCPSWALRKPEQRRLLARPVEPGLFRRQTKAKPIEQTDVLVLGAGTMGATATLARLGARVQRVNRYNWTATTPRAPITHQRAVEVLRDLGVEEDAKRVATPWEWMGNTLFTTSLSGPEIVRMRTWGMGDKRIGDYLHRRLPARQARAGLSTRRGTAQALA